VTSLEALTDQEICERAAANDDQAFAVIISRYKTPVFAFIRRYVGGDEDAHDLLQQVFVAAWQGFDRYDLDRPLGPWLTAIALNKCRDHSRKRRVRSFFQLAWPTQALDVPDTAPAADILISANQELLLLERAITLLPRGLKEPLLLTVFEGFSHQQAGVQLGLSAKAIEGRTRRARQELERQISAWTDNLGARN
jgi:RNA polymerase sigma factor CnrH